jgi:hypothetical protein
MINDLGSDDLPALSFVICLSSPETLRANLLASPCLRPGTPHQVITIEGCPSAAHGLNAGFHQARHELLVCVHQDVYLPEGWDRCLAQQNREAERRLGRPAWRAHTGSEWPDETVYVVARVFLARGCVALNSR